MSPDAPPIGVGGPASAAWREDSLMHAEELRGLASWIARDGNGRISDELRESIDRHIDAAREVAGGTDSRGWPARTIAALRGSSVERTLGNLDAVETTLLRLAPDDYGKGQMAGLLAPVQRFLPQDDPRRIRVVQIADRLDATVLIGHVKQVAERRNGDEPIRPWERDTVVGAY